MANLKISQLTANPAITGAEEIPTAKSGANYKVTFDELRAWNFTPIPITYADLAAADDGLYILTDGNNIGLIVTKAEGGVEPKAFLNSSQNSRGFFTVDTQVGSTSGTLTVNFDATPLNSAPVAWADTDAVEDIATNIAAAIDAAGFSAFTVGATVYIWSNTTNDGTMSITTNTGDDLVTTNVSDYLGGGNFTLEADYDFINDLVKTYSYNNNIVSHIVVGFDYIRFYGNNLAQDGGTNFTAFAGTFNYNNVYGASLFVLAGSNADVSKNNIYNATTVDLSLLKSGNNFGGNDINIGTHNTLTPATDYTEGNVNLETSNYANKIPLSGGGTRINFNAIGITPRPDFNWTGIVTVKAAGTLDEILHGEMTSKYITIKPPAPISSGSLINGAWYVISNIAAGDDFSNVGYVSSGVPFQATGTTPTSWTNGTLVYGGIEIGGVNIILKSSTPSITLFGLDKLELERNSYYDYWLEVNLSQYDYSFLE